ncbi:MAG: hypothetical protein KTR28_01485 [Micavibrio sp.]|nr:hypothetical protein [Micavibrio sp.]
MVDTVKGVGAPQSIQTVKNNVSSKEDRATKESQNTSVDKVEISEEALSLSQTEELVANTRDYLENNTDESLSRNKSFDELL